MCVWCECAGFCSASASNQYVHHTFVFFIMLISTVNTPGPIVARFNDKLWKVAAMRFFPSSGVSRSSLGGFWPGTLTSACAPFLSPTPLTLPVLVTWLDTDDDTATLKTETMVRYMVHVLALMMR